MNSLSNSESPLKEDGRSSSVLFERTFALRQGFKPLPDYWLYLKLTPMGIAVSLQEVVPTYLKIAVTIGN
ncbi:MAG: hypothetical protein EAZ09_00880 [Oscillatoriales cyanobacterium]|nr:MAG: hypothetical protein EAZ09_00880 [Oscillatoriales cyanobacterium]